MTPAGSFSQRAAMPRPWRGVLICIWCGACAPVPTANGAFDELARNVQSRLGRQTHWLQGTAEDVWVHERIAALLEGELAVEDAVQVGLLSNRSLQATYEELGIAQADIVQASTIRNPMLTLLGRFPVSRGVTNGEISILQDFLDVFMLPLRLRLAREQFDTARLRVTQAVFDTAYAIRRVYYELQAAQATVSARQQALQEIQHSQELAVLRRKGATPGDLDVAIGRGLYEQVQLDLARDEIHMLTQRATLTRLLGLWGDQSSWRIPLSLPALPPHDPSLEGLEALALASRYDLAAAQVEVKMQRDALESTQNTRWLGSVVVGGATARDAEGTHVAGPTVALELPFFNRRQGAIARLTAQLKQAERREEQLEITIRAEVRQVQATLSRVRRLVEPYKDSMIPLRSHIRELTQERYNLGHFDAYQLLLAKQAEVLAHIEHIEALRDYWLTRAGLEHSVGAVVDTLQPDATLPPHPL